MGKTQSATHFVRRIIRRNAVSFQRSSFCRAKGRWFVFILTLSISWNLRADSSVTIQATISVPGWDGWGTSLAWWANAYGGRSDFANLLFTTNQVTLNGVSLPGLGLNIARYNIGASLTNVIQGGSMHASTNIPAFKQIPGYWLNWFDADPTSASWNWANDSRQRAALQAAKARGVNHVQLFSNSPLWWMCYNHNPSGSDSGGSDNLQSWNDQQHAVYLATVARYFEDHWQITVDSVEPFNEPSAAWWKAQGTQEGCHFDVSTQAAVIPYLRAELDRRGLTNTVVAASDETSYSAALNTWNQLPAKVRSQIGQVNVHGYEYGNGPRAALAQATAGTRLWNSEYGEGDASGLSLAKNLGLDMALLRPSAWCYWQPFDYGGWGLIQADPSTLWIGPVNSKYQVLAQYTRHIRPGQSLLETSDASTVAAYDEAARRLVVVTVNPGAAQTISYDLSGWFSIGGPVRTWTTVTDGSVRYRFDGSEVLPSGTKSLSRLFPAGSVQTIEIDQVDRLAPPPHLAIRRSASSFRLTLEWPMGASPLTLQKRQDLVGTEPWISLTNHPIKSGTNWAVTVNAPMIGSAYFRLITP